MHHLIPLISFITCVYAATPTDLITALPGWNGSTPTPQYSGLIEIDPINGKFFHYWFVQSELDPANAPVVLWLNGGPGCSSLDGYFYEQGPFHFTSSINDDDIPTLVSNPYAWNRIANMLFLESPAGVGFSYSNNPSDYYTNDTQTAIDNYNFLLKWFISYPEYCKNEFYIMGESYAGIYIPTLVDRIRIGNDVENAYINLQGFAIGNGCIGNTEGACTTKWFGHEIDFLHNHGLFSTNLYNQIIQACPDPYHPFNESLTCDILLTEMGIQVSHVNVYNIYAPCILPLSIPPHHIRHRTHYMRAHFIGGPDACLDGLEAAAYLNNDLVRANIHVQNMSFGGEWSICSTTLFYIGDIPSLLSLYPTLISKYRVAIYNGDVDACIPYTWDEQWTASLGYPIKSGWHAWTTNNQVSGYATIYDVDNSSFSFITVKGSGHMVPQYMPAQAFELFRRFIHNLPF